MYAQIDMVHFKTTGDPGTSIIRSTISVNTWSILEQAIGWGFAFYNERIMKMQQMLYLSSFLWRRIIFINFKFNSDRYLLIYK